MPSPHILAPFLLLFPFALSVPVDPRNLFSLQVRQLISQLQQGLIVSSLTPSLLSNHTPR